MNRQKLDSTIKKAEQVCERTGSRLTDKRRDILEILLSSENPLSAYDISDAYNKKAEKPMPTMSVYRILDFLEAEHLVHKLSSTNKYVACSHIDCGHQYEIPQFLICAECETTSEVAVSTIIYEELNKLVSKAGYTLGNSKLELQCLCNKCSARTV